MRPSSRNCNPGPDFVFSELVFRADFFSRGVFFSQTPVCRAASPRRPPKTDPRSRCVIWCCAKSAAVIDMLSDLVRLMCFMYLRGGWKPPCTSAQASAQNELPGVGLSSMLGFCSQVLGLCRQLCNILPIIFL